MCFMESLRIEFCSCDRAFMVVPMSCYAYMGCVILLGAIQKEQCMIKAVVFDMDGLMFDTERIYMDAWDYTGEQLGLGKIGYFSIRTLGKTDQSIKQDIINEFGGHITPEMVFAHINTYKAQYFASNHVPVKKGLYELLEYLKRNGYKIGLASSSRPDEIHKHLLDAGIGEYFEAIVSGRMVAHSKPAPDIYLLACEKLGILVSECMALEDSINGIRSASDAGLMPVMIPDLIQPDEETLSLLHAQLPDLLSVVGLLENLKTECVQEIR